MKRCHLAFILVTLLLMGPFVFNSYALAADKLGIGLIPIVDCLQAFVAVDKGFFAKEGIEAKLQYMAGGAKILPAVAGGSLGIGFSSVTSVILSADRGFDFIIVADGAYEPPQPPWTSVIMARKEAGIKEPKDLVGKKVAVNTIHQISDLYVMEMVRRAGGDPKKIIWLEIPFPNMGAALVSKQVDAANLVEPFYTIYKGKPDLVLAFDTFHPLRRRGIIANYVSTKKWVQANSDLVKRFASAIAKATDYISANQREARAVLPKFTRLSPELAMKVGIKDFGKSVDIEGLQWTSDLIYNFGWIKRKQDVRDFVHVTAR
ncbi:MAG: ABC transporter substrate-binding protein [Thermodesulfobacteriota bacterium]